jgi:hypothetical protein
MVEQVCGKWKDDVPLRPVLLPLLGLLLLLPLPE